MDQDYDLVVIGSGPAGQKAAINASKLGKRVAVIERAGMVGGVSVHSGTIPSKTLRDAILYLTGFNERSFYGQDYRLRDRISSEEIARSSADDCDARNQPCSVAIQSQQNYRA